MATPSFTAAPGTSPKYARGRALRRYALRYGLALAAFSSIRGGTGALLPPDQVQNLEVAKFFTGRDAGVADFGASRARSLVLVASIGLAVTSVAQPLIGMFADRTRTRLGRRARWILLGSLVGAGFLVVVRFAPSVAALSALGLDSYFVFAALVVLCVVLFVWPDLDAAGRDLGVAGPVTNLGQALGPWVASLALVALAGIAILPVRRR
ncbi:MULTISPECIES: hypothetical protein [Streptomyces]|uniref:MFS transporter n=2 Tax=Streptomyces TaxID=1883 RepID=A0ABV9J2V6_9ACTN